MIYERADQAENKPENNLTGVRGREADAEVKAGVVVGENCLWFRNT